MPAVAKKVKNERQIISKREAMADPSYSDILYAYLQSISQTKGIASKENNIRYLTKDQVKWVAIETGLTHEVENEKTKRMEMRKVISRKTVPKYFNYLVERGYLIPLADDPMYAYSLKVLQPHEANLIEAHTLEVLHTCFQRHSINIYMYLINKYFAAGGNEFVITMKETKEYIGIASSTTSNNSIVSNTLEVLERLDLIKTRRVVNANNGHTIIHVLYVRRALPPKEEV